MTNWTTTGDDFATAVKIVERAEKMKLYRSFPSSTRVQRLMDVIAVHLNIVPLDLKRWLEADDFNFSHDIAGITQHLVRTDPPTMGGSFLPRFAKKEEVA